MSWNHELERYERKHLSKKGEHYRITAMSYLRRMGKHSNKSLKRLTLKDFESFLGPLDLSKLSIKAVHTIVKACARWLNGGETPKHFPDLGDIATVTYEDTLRVKKPSELLTDEEFEDLCGVLSKRDEVIVRLIRGRLRNAKLL
ncbi:MAG: hypothetical protein V3W22_06320 [Thermoplasmata archaeon]